MGTKTKFASFNSWATLSSKYEYLSIDLHAFKLSNGREKSRSQSFLTYSRETGFPVSYEEVGNLHRPIEASNEIYRVSEFDYSLSFGTKQNSLRQIFFALWFFKDLFTKNKNWFFFNFFLFYVGSIKKCIHICLNMQIQENMFMSIAAHLWRCFLVF